MPNMSQALPLQPITWTQMSLFGTDCGDMVVGKSLEQTRVPQVQLCADDGDKAVRAIAEIY